MTNVDHETDHTLATTSTPIASLLARALPVLNRLWQGFRNFNAETIELQERLILINRPWEEEFLHYAYDGTEWHLHGHLPPPDRRVRSITSSGWCPGLQTERFPFNSDRGDRDA